MSTAPASNEALAPTECLTPYAPPSNVLPPQFYDPPASDSSGEAVGPYPRERPASFSGGAASKLVSAFFGFAFRFTAALCLLAAASYIFKDADFLPPANIPCAAVIAVLGTPGLALLISLNLLL